MAGLFLIHKKNLKYFCQSAMETEEISRQSKIFAAFEFNK